MRNSHNSSVAVPTSVVAGAATAVGNLGRKTVSIEGTFTATYQVQITLDDGASPAAASWMNEGAALTAPGAIEISKICAAVRVNCTAHTSSSSPVGRVSGEL